MKESKNFNILLYSAKIQTRVIGALLMRETLTRYGRHNIGFMWMFIEPMMFTLGIAGLWTFAKGSHGTIPIIPFAVTGYSSVLLWRNMPNRCSGAIEPNLSLMYHRNVKVLDIFLSRILLECAGTTMSFSLLCLVFTTTGSMGTPEDILKILLAWGLLAWFGGALAITIGALSELSSIIEKIWHPVTYIMFPLSGAMFMVDWLPDSLGKIILLFPMVHGVELLRDGYFGTAIRTHYDISYMATTCLFLTAIGLALTRIIGRKVTPE